MIALTCIAIFSGCAAMGSVMSDNLFSTGQYKKETVPNSQTYFRQMWAAEDKGEFRVSGYLSLKGMIGVHVPDYVEVVLVQPNGEILDTQKVVYYPRSLYGRSGHREGRFRATFAQAPPAGTTIRLSNVN